MTTMFRRRQLHWPSRLHSPSIKPRLHGWIGSGELCNRDFYRLQWGLDFRILVGVVQLDGNWSRELDYHGESISMQLVLLPSQQYLTLTSGYLSRVSIRLVF